MCLGVPMRIVSIDGSMAVCEAKGVYRDVGLLLVGEENVSIGDYVVVHVGYAIEKMSFEQAAEAWRLLEEILAPVPEPGNA